MEVCLFSCDERAYVGKKISVMSVRERVRDEGDEGKTIAGEEIEEGDRSNTKEGAKMEVTR